MDHPIDCVTLHVYGADGALLGETEVSTQDWGETSHPLIVCEEDRQRLGVTRIEGRHWSTDGQLLHAWVNRYGPEGDLISSAPLT